MREKDGLCCILRTNVAALDKGAVRCFEILPLQQKKKSIFTV